MGASGGKLGSRFSEYSALGGLFVGSLLASWGCARARRIRVVVSLLVVIATMAVLVPAGSGRLAVPPKVYPTVYFDYTNDCTFTMQNDAGA